MQHISLRNPLAGLLPRSHRKYPPARSYPRSTRAIWSWMKTPLLSSPQASGGSAGTRWICSYLVFWEEMPRARREGRGRGFLLGRLQLEDAPLLPQKSLVYDQGAAHAGLGEMHS